MQQRYYDPAIGRFLSIDPANAGFNPFAYANDNPNRFVDPDGRASMGASNYIPTTGGSDYTMASQSSAGPMGDSTASSAALTLNYSAIRVARDLRPTGAADVKLVTNQLTRIQNERQMNFVKSTDGIRLILNIVSNPTRDSVGSLLNRAGRTATVNFNPLYGLRVSNLRQPPRLALFHELAHVYDYFVNGKEPGYPGDPSRDNAFVIPRETAYAQKLGVVFRNAHDVGDLIKYGEEK